MNNSPPTSLESQSHVDTKNGELCTILSPGAELGQFAHNVGQIGTLKMSSTPNATYDSVMDFGKLTFIKNSRGKFVVYVNGYRYVKQNEAHQKTYWKCSLAIHSSKEVADNSGKTGCPGRLNIDIQGRATVTKGHNHLPDYDKQEQEEALARMKERMRREGCSAKEVYQLEANKQAQSGQAAPNYKTVQSILYRTKKRLADEESPSMVTSHVSPGVLLGAGPVDTGSGVLDSVVCSPVLDTAAESARTNDSSAEILKTSMTNHAPSGNLLQQFIFSDANVSLLETNNADVSSSNLTKRARTAIQDESVVAKTCAWGLCNNSSDKADFLPSDLTFIRFPNSRRDPDRCKIWLKLCDRQMKIEEVTAWTSVCSIHFHGGDGPTLEHPNPLPAADLIYYQKDNHGPQIDEESSYDASTNNSILQLPHSSELNHESLVSVSIKDEPRDSLTCSPCRHDQDDQPMLPDGLNVFDCKIGTHFDLDHFLLRYVPLDVVHLLRLAALDQPRLLANLTDADLDGVEELCRLHAAELPQKDRSRLVGENEIFQCQPHNYRLLPGYRVALRMASSDLRARGWTVEPRIDNIMQLNGVLRQTLPPSAAEELYLEIGALDGAVELRCIRCQRIYAAKTCVSRMPVSQFDQLLKIALQHSFAHK